MVGTTIHNQVFGAKYWEKSHERMLSLTPGTPRFTARRLEIPDDKMSPEEQETYRSVVGTLLH